MIENPAEMTESLGEMRGSPAEMIEFPEKMTESRDDKSPFAHQTLSSPSLQMKEEPSLLLGERVRLTAPVLHPGKWDVKV